MDERFTMQDVCDLLHLPVASGRRSVNIQCPSCGKGREKKLNINFEKDAFRCAKCGAGGYAVHLWALFRDIPIEDMTAATKDYYSFKGDSPIVKRKVKTPISVEIPTSPIDVRDKTFSSLLKILTLSKEHEEALIKRGLSKEAIEKNEYRSYPLTSFSVIAAMLLERGCIIEGCPGFYKDNNGNWALRELSSGILIPQRDGFGRIEGFQIRLDKSESSKYLTLSTYDFKCGARGLAYPHFRLGSKGLSEVIVTEGPLKGDIISHFTGYSVLSIQGVNAVSMLPSVFSQLREKGTTKILTAFDMDIQNNENVKKADIKLKEMISNAGFSYQTLVWDEKFKGLDDWLLANRKDLRK